MPEIEVRMSQVEQGELFDRAELSERLEGDDELLAELVGLFLEDAPGQIARVRQAVDSGVADDAQRAAHSLKGAAASVAAPGVQRTALSIEKQAEAKNLAEARRLCDQLQSDFDGFRQAVVALGLATS